MFGFFMFGQPMFADVPLFGTTVASSGGGGGPSRHRHEDDEQNHRTLENQIEITLMAFLNTRK